MKGLALKLGLTEKEFELIVQYLKRAPTSLEVSLFSAMWSEHCSYKSSRRVLKNFPTKGYHVLQGPGENAGIVDIGGEWAACFKVESHNHPSYLEPYQGAATGVGGILRDIFTMGARPIASLNLLFFGNLENPKTRYIMKGVVAGIGGYGNCIGVPTVGTSVFFHPSYEKNPLVNAFTLGIMRKDKIFLGRAQGVGNSIMYVGAKTGRDGIGGAIMASQEFDQTSEEKKPTVQVGDPFMEKLLLEACLEAMEQDFVIGIQDMGAAGLTCATFEMADRGKVGMKINLSKVPTRAQGMGASEIMMSESQERMLLCVKKGYEEETQKLFSKWDLDASLIGEVIESPYIKIEWEGSEIGEIPVEPLVSGAPLYNRPRKEKRVDPSPAAQDDKKRPTQSEALLLLNSVNLTSRRWVLEQYDRSVGTNTLAGGFDAPLVRVRENNTTLALSMACFPRVSLCNPNIGGVWTILMAAQNLACVGARPLGITDCLNFGSPENPEVMWQFEQSVLGMSQAARVLDIPVISGNVSFYNETDGAAILPSPSIVMVGLIQENEKPCSHFFQKEGDLIYLFGTHEPTLSGSEYQSLILKKEEGQIPEIDIEKKRKEYEFLRALIQKGLIQSAKNISLGGLFQALTVSCRSGLGAEVEELDVTSLFGEVGAGILISIPASQRGNFEKEVHGNDMANADRLQPIGVVRGQNLKIGNGISISLKEIEKISEEKLPEMLHG